MKRLALLTVMCALLFTFSVMVIDEQTTAGEYPLGVKYSGTHTFEVHLDTPMTSSNDSCWDTSDVVGEGMSSPPLLFTDINNYNSVSGYLNIVVLSLDTNAGGEYQDTTGDSIVGRFYTDWGTTASQRLVYTVETKLPKAGVTFYFNIPPDSVLGDRIYMWFEHIISDSDHSVAVSELGVTYRATAEWRARP